MEQRIINPWMWQDDFGFVQAKEISGAKHLLFCAGQISGDAEGRPLHVGDMQAQLLQALDNLETVLQEAGFKLADVVRLNYYTTDVDGFFAALGPFNQRLLEAECRPTSTLLGVARLAAPEFLVEIEATAVTGH